MTAKTQEKISGLIITLNEERNIESVIRNLDFVDEIIVVDSYSTDKTIEILQKHPHVRVVQNKFENYTTQRNLALDLAQNEWILFLDADERLTPELKQEIIDTLNNNPQADAYYFYRKLYFKGNPVHFSGWQTDKNIRLFKKSKARYIPDRLVHEILKVDGKKAVFKHKLIHYSYTDYESYKAKMIYYAHLKAKELFAKNVRPNWFHFYIKPAYKFLYTYIVRLGFLDGKKGIILCYLNALSVYKRYPELKRLHAEK